MISFEGNKKKAEYSKVGERETLNFHRHTSILHQIVIGTQGEVQTDQEKSQGLQLGILLNHGSGLGSTTLESPLKSQDSSRS